MTHFVVNRFYELRKYVSRLEEANSRKIKIIVVTKDQSPESITPLLEAGHRDFAESRVQPALARWSSLKQQYPDVRLHFIGQLQTNKTEIACPIFDCIQTVDRPHLAHKLINYGKPIFIQIQFGALNQSRGGIAAHQADQLVGICRTLGLDVAGVMTIPPLNCDAAECFDELYGFAVRHGLKEVSMGMSNDYQQAIAAGSTMIRIGRGLFTPHYPLVPEGFS